MQRILDLTLEDVKEAEFDTFVHQMLVPIREEPIFHYINPRHYVAVKKDAIERKSVFSGWKANNIEAYSAIYKCDWPQT